MAPSQKFVYILFDTQGDTRDHTRTKAVVETIHYKKLGMYSSKPKAVEAAYALLDTGDDLSLVILKYPLNAPWPEDIDDIFHRYAAIEKVWDTSVDYYE